MGKISMKKKDNFFINKSKNGSKQQTSTQKFKKLNQPNLAANKSFNSLIYNMKLSTSGLSKSDGFFVTKDDDNRDDITSKSTSIKKQFDNKNRTGGTSDSTSTTEKPQDSNSDKPKKPFDKKKWRLQKYSKKYKLEQWEERRKNNLLSEYYKQVENEPKFNVQEIYKKYADEDDVDNDNGNSSKASSDPNYVASSNTPATFSNKREFVSARKKNANEEFQRKQQLKKQRKEEIEKKRAEKAEAARVYKQKKLEKYKKLNKKTRKGQPIMKYRMEMLLEQIQKSTQQ